MVQWLRIHLAMQGRWVSSLIGELKSQAMGQLSPRAAMIEPEGHD